MKQQTQDSGISKASLILAVLALVMSAVVLSSIFFTQDDQTSVGQSEELSASNEVELSAATLDTRHSDMPDHAVVMANDEPLPKSLRGTDIGYKLLTDEAGNLRISSDVKEVFDFFLSAMVDEDIDQIVARINQHLSDNLSGEALAQARTILDQYLTMKEALYDYEVEAAENLALEDAQSVSAYERLAQRVETRNRIRKDSLDPEVYESFYAREEAYDNHTLARLAIQQDASLNEAQKAAALEALEDQAPEFIKAARADSQRIETLRSQTERLAKQSDEIGQQEAQAQIDELRRDMYGDEAVERFKALDQQRAEWQARLDDYFEQKQAISNREGVSESDISESVEALRSSLFTEQEQIRVKVLERS